MVPEFVKPTKMYEKIFIPTYLYYRERFVLISLQLFPCFPLYTKDIWHFWHNYCPIKNNQPTKSMGEVVKLIIAYIQPERLNTVKQALFERQIYKMSITNALGCGEQEGYHENYRGADIEVNLLKKIRLEIAINSEFLQAVIDGIISGSHTGEIGDGKIFIHDLEDCIRIRTGEKGQKAIG
jgi:nitrogen regulatory protein P-II 2